MQVATVKQNLTTSGTTQLDTIRKVLGGKRIADATDTELAETHTRLFFVIGLRPQHFPSKEEDRAIYGYLRANYGHKTLDELLYAFNLAIKGELNLKADDVKVYDQYSIAYVVRIMEAYRVWLLSQAEKVPEPKRQELPPPKISPEEAVQYAREAYLATGNAMLIPVTIWKYLKISLPENEKEVIRTKAKSIVNSMWQDDPKMFTDKHDFNYWVDRVCKQIAIAEYFKK